jgi:hypothetical protein
MRALCRGDIVVDWFIIDVHRENEVRGDAQAVTLARWASRLTPRSACFSVLAESPYERPPRRNIRSPHQTPPGSDPTLTQGRLSPGAWRVQPDSGGRWRPAVSNAHIHWGGNRTQTGAFTQQVLASVLRTSHQRQLDAAPLLVYMQRRARIFLRTSNRVYSLSVVLRRTTVRFWPLQLTLALAAFIVAPGMSSTKWVTVPSSVCTEPNALSTSARDVP